MRRWSVFESAAVLLEKSDHETTVSLCTRMSTNKSLSFQRPFRKMMLRLLNREVMQHNEQTYSSDIHNMNEGNGLI